ncbi:hypothetical protein BH11BAC1_BH11BAC1_12020 [soil metagenome]
MTKEKYLKVFAAIDIPVISAQPVVSFVQSPEPSLTLETSK